VSRSLKVGTPRCLSKIKALFNCKVAPPSQLAPEVYFGFRPGPSTRGGVRKSVHYGFGKGKKDIWRNASKNFIILLFFVVDGEMKLKFPTPPPLTGLAHQPPPGRKRTFSGRCTKGGGGVINGATCHPSQVFTQKFQNTLQAMVWGLRRPQRLRQC
jgi:hypothetical protein